MFPFLSLPREIRDTIYTLCLFTTTFIIPHPQSYQRATNWGGAFPTLALLSVCKQIRAEARPVFYLKNRWQVALAKKRTLFHKVEPWFFEHLQLSFTDEDGPRVNRMLTASGLHSQSDDDLFGPNTTLTEDEKRDQRWRYMHNKYLREVLAAWDDKVELLLEDLPYARTVRVNFGRLSCPVGCCRVSLFESAPIRRLLESLRREDSSFVHGRPEVTFFGLETQAERTLLVEVYGFERYCDIDYRRPTVITPRAEEGNANGDQEERAEN